MAVKTNMRLIAIMALIGTISSPLFARTPRAAVGGRPSAGARSFNTGGRSAGRGSLKSDSSRGWRRSSAQGSFTRPSSGSRRHAARAESVRTRSFSGTRNTRVYRPTPFNSIRYKTYSHTFGTAGPRYYRYHRPRHARHSSFFFYVGLPYYGYYYSPYPYYYSAWPYYYYSIPHYRYYYRYPRYYFYEYHRYNYQLPAYQPPPTNGRRDSRDEKPQEGEEAPPRVPTEESPDEIESVRPDANLMNIADTFAAGEYQEAAAQAKAALIDEPENRVLPFVYAQALFADGKYSQAADVLREAVRNLDAERQELFYPLGFYRDEDVLNGQVDKLREAAAAEPSNPDLELLLGYQLLGLGRYEDALNALEKAQADYVNREAASTMIDILEEARSTDRDT